MAVKATTLDAFVMERAIDRLDLIKVDVEGFEMAVIDGAPESLARFRPDLFIEFNSFTLIAFGNINPGAMAERLMEMFPFVHRFKDAAPVHIDSNEKLLDFLHGTLIQHGCIDDLYGTFDNPF